MEDKLLLGRFCAGDRLGFDRLVLKYRHRIIALCVRLLSDRDEAEDAAQETFVKVYRNIDGFRGDALFSTWLYRIAVNVCRNHRRSWWSRLWRRSEQIDTGGSAAGDDAVQRGLDLPSHDPLPDQDLERGRLADRVQRALRSLPAKHRELIVLRDMQDKTYEEMEQITGLASGTLKSRLARARAALQEKLRGVLDE